MKKVALLILLAVACTGCQAGAKWNIDSNGDVGTYVESKTYDNIVGK